jgi:mycoredoxin
MTGNADPGQSTSEPDPQTTEPKADVTPPGLTVCSTSWCGSCHRLMTQLDRAGVAYASIDIERDAEAARYVMRVNGGNQTVPTVVFPDGRALTNPSLKDVLARLGA